MNMRRKLLAVAINQACHGTDKLTRDAMLGIWKNRIIL